MKRLILTSLVLLCVFNANATDLRRILLDKITFSVASSAWVTTQSAELTVQVNASLAHADVVKTRLMIMSRLGDIAGGDWHITQFDRSQDASGLEQLIVSARARLTADKLTGIYDKAKSISQPGTTYRILSVEFKPSLSDMQRVRSELRETLYRQANDEMARINKIYTNAPYTLSRLDFNEGNAPQPLMAKRLMMAEANGSAAPMADNAPPVSQEIIMTALVTAAANRTGDVTSAVPATH